MKNLNKLLLTTIFTVACGTEQPSQETDAILENNDSQEVLTDEEISENKKTREAVKAFTETSPMAHPYTIYLNLPADLPLCDKANAGQVAFVNQEKTFYSCQNDDWVEVDVQGKDGLNGKAGSKGDKGDKGDKGEDGVNGNDGADGMVSGLNVVTDTGKALGSMLSYDFNSNAGYFRSAEKLAGINYKFSMDVDTLEWDSSLTPNFETGCKYTTNDCTGSCILSSDRYEGWLIYDDNQWHLITENRTTETYRIKSFKAWGSNSCSAADADFTGYAANVFSLKPGFEMDNMNPTYKYLGE